MENVARPGGINDVDLKAGLMAQRVIFQPEAAVTPLRDVNMSVCERLCFFQRVFGFLPLR